MRQGKLIYQKGDILVIEFSALGSGGTLGVYRVLKEFIYKDAYKKIQERIHDWDGLQYLEVIRTLEDEGLIQELPESECGYEEVRIL